MVVQLLAMIISIGIIWVFLVFVLGSEIDPNPSPPFWGGNPTYTVNVTLLNNNPVIIWNFTYHYNWNLKSQRYEHYGPQADEMCLFANPPFSINDSCTVIFAKDGWSYVMYPAYKWCCKCGDSFGAIKYDWLQNNSKYQGQEIIDGIVVQHWVKNGLFINHYYNTVGGMPVKFHQIKLGKPKEWNFDLKSYTKSVEDSLFDPPLSCSNLCEGECRHFRKSQPIKTQKQHLKDQ